MFLPEKYKVPSTSNYMKFVEGRNQFRVLSSAVIGYEYWTTDNKPVRSRELPEEVPENIKKDDKGNYRVNHFWAFLVWNYEAERAQILQLTQKSIMEMMKEYVDNPAWGDPQKYDFVVARTGAGFDTEYKVSVNPHSPMPKEAEKAPKVDLEMLFDNEDPFKK